MEPRLQLNDFLRNSLLQSSLRVEVGFVVDSRLVHKVIVALSTPSQTCDALEVQAREENGDENVSGNAVVS